MTATLNSIGSEQTSGNRLVRAFESLRDRRYRAWFLSQIFSSSGSMTSAVAQSWLVLQISGSAVDIALITALMFLPTLFGGAWAGALADRIDVRRLLLATNVAFAALAAAQAVLIATGGIRLWMLFAFSALNGVVFALDQPARQVYVFELVGPARITSAVGLYEVVLNASRALGPAAGGVLLATAGVAACLLFNALTYVPVAVLLVRFRVHPARREPARAAPPGHRTRAGLAAVRRDPAILACVVLAAVSGMVFNLGVTTPLFATSVLHLGGGGYGALTACFGLGALPGAFMAASTHGTPSPRVVRLLALATALAVLATSLTPVPAGAFAGMAIVGFCSIWLVATANTLVQLAAAPGLRGLVMGIWAMALPGANPLTGLAAGAVAQLSPRAGLGLGGALMLVVAAATWSSLRPRN
ncbi:MFS transporter [Dactylosporangium sp. NPDC000244]|uniref:MFS transporter n=1 Tax=Dactylosporangium sp. NPDC000244 TaxID=3154365 RepID=UPI00332E44C4